jgi:hypothetical protein
LPSVLLGLAAGYEDLNDHNLLRLDPSLPWPSVKRILLELGGLARNSLGREGRQEESEVLPLIHLLALAQATGCIDRAEEPEICFKSSKYIRQLAARRLTKQFDPPLTLKFSLMLHRKVSDPGKYRCYLDLVVHRHQVVVQFSPSRMKPRFHRP